MYLPHSHRISADVPFRCFSFLFLALASMASLLALAFFLRDSVMLATMLRIFCKRSSLPSVGLPPLPSASSMVSRAYFSGCLGGGEGGLLGETRVGEEAFLSFLR